MARVKIEMDFVEDIRARCVAELAAFDYKLPPSSGDAHKDAHDACVDYWNATNRRIPLRTRQVHWSNELRAREPSLAPDARSALATIEQESRKGEDLNRRYSKSLKKLQYNDLMLNDWGIHHLHLGLVVGKDGFSSTAQGTCCSCSFEMTTCTSSIYAHTERGPTRISSRLSMRIGQTQSRIPGSVVSPDLASHRSSARTCVTGT